MGSAISKAADGLGSLIGNAIAAPFKTVLGESCQGVCLGTWDLFCFIEHLCVTKIVKLLMVLGLCYIILLFVYLLFKLGIVQCIVRNLCRMCCAACGTYWYALEDLTCCLWHKLKNTKRIDRRRRHGHQDIESGCISSEESDLYVDSYLHHHRDDDTRGRRKRKSYRGRTSHRISGKRHLRLRQVSFRVKGRSERGRSSRRICTTRKMHNARRKTTKFKRRKMH